jgi:hypothetical protein
MKTNRVILIAVIILIAAAIIGLFAFFYFRNPKSLTTTPSEIISGENIGVESLPENGGSPLSLGDCLIVSDQDCGNSSILRKADGTPFGGIGFSDIAVGTKLYAPIGGYTTIFTVNTSSGAEYTAIALAEDANWTSDNLVGRYLVFRADGLDVLTNEVLKGEAFAEVRENGEIYSGSYDRKTVLAVNLDAEWAEMIDSSIEDAGFYMASAIEKIELE